jgi:hypothetical protein
MTLLLITSLAFGGTTKSIKVTKVDFEEMTINVKLAKPNLKLITETKRPVFKPLTPRPMKQHNIKKFNLTNID